MSIDRDNSSLGYTIENCLPCCVACNRIKVCLKHGEFLEHMRRIATYPGAVALAASAPLSSFKYAQSPECNVLPAASSADDAPATKTKRRRIKSGFRGILRVGGRSAGQYRLREKRPDGTYFDKHFHSLAACYRADYTLRRLDDATPRHAALTELQPLPDTVVGEDDLYTDDELFASKPGPKRAVSVVAKTPPPLQDGLVLDWTADM